MPSLKSFFTRALVAAATVSATGLASAEAVVFFGSDPLAAGTVPAGGNAQTARGQFAASLLTSSTENFEAATTGFQPNSASPQAVLGSTGSMFRNDGALGTTRIENRTVIGGSNTGRFNTSSAGAGKWWETSASFTLSLSSTVQAIGFYGTDFGDFAGTLTLHLFNGDSAVATDIVVPPGGGANGSLLFYGYVNSALNFNRVVFTVGQATPGNINSYDFVGFDDLVVGRTPGTTPPPGVPTPGTLALAALSLGLLGCTRRRRRS